MLIKLFEKNPDQRQIEIILKALQQGEIIVYPTDTVYAIGCDIANKAAVEKIARVKNLNPKKSNFSIICSSLSQVSLKNRTITCQCSNQLMIQQLQ